MYKWKSEQKEAVKSEKSPKQGGPETFLNPLSPCLIPTSGNKPMQVSLSFPDAWSPNKQTRDTNYQCSSIQVLAASLAGHIDLAGDIAGEARFSIVMEHHASHPQNSDCIAAWTCGVKHRQRCSISNAVIRNRSCMPKEPSAYSYRNRQIYHKNLLPGSSILDISHHRRSLSNILHDWFGHFIPCPMRLVVGSTC